MSEEDVNRVPDNGIDIEMEDDDEHETTDKVPKKKKRGIIFLPTIPPYMNVAKIREIFGEHGEVGRIFLQPNTHKQCSMRRARKMPNQFTEGWVEFERKRVAKHVASTLNNQPIDTRKKSRYCDMLWSIKYIPRFKWIHLSERLAYEKAASKQRLHAEIAQAKKEANYLQSNVEKSKRMNRAK